MASTQLPPHPTDPRATCPHVAPKLGPKHGGSAHVPGTAHLGCYVKTTEVCPLGRCNPECFLNLSASPSSRPHETKIGPTLKRPNRLGLSLLRYLISSKSSTTVLSPCTTARNRSVKPLNSCRSRCKTVSQLYHPVG